MKKILGVAAAACVAAALAGPAVATAAVNTATTTLPTPLGTLEMQVTADCPGDDGKCFFRTQASLLTPTGPIGLPQETWARQTITLRSTDRQVWQEAWFSAPAGMPRTDESFIVCSDMQVVVGGVNVRIPAACAQTTFG